ncbi:hypothetical protein B9Z19DRAFT_1061246 [Tuber borchii]|uniref:Uncharacterized protein n=1 Tax=Tuber borchii TaxID=42251 RepID=A0A2T7A5S4_TUBBO|nr:hypothetical protein B9Z19DRAFT_1061246 [Tuber borchii]
MYGTREALTFCGSVWEGFPIGLWGTRREIATPFSNQPTPENTALVTRNRKNHYPLTELPFREPKSQDRSGPSFLITKPLSEGPITSRLSTPSNATNTTEAKAPSITNAAVLVKDSALYKHLLAEGEKGKKLAMYVIRKRARPDYALNLQPAPAVLPPYFYMGLIIEEKAMPLITNRRIIPVKGSDEPQQGAEAQDTITDSGDCRSHSPDTAETLTQPFHSCTTVDGEVN